MAIESPDGSDARMDMAALGQALRRRWLRIVTVTLVLMAVTYAVLLFVPRSYESTAGILVGDRDNTYTQPATASAAAAPAPQDTEALINSEIQFVQSPDTLMPVVRALKLADDPEFNGNAGSPFAVLARLFRHGDAASPEDIALTSLGQHLTVIRERDSALIDIVVRSRDAQLAAKLANAIAEADVARRTGLSLSDTADASQWLDQQVTELRQRVSDAETKVANFKIANDLYTGSNNTSLTGQQLSEVATQITAAQQARDTARSHADLIRGLLDAGQPIDGVDDVRNSVTIQQLLQQKATLTAQRAQLLATLLPSHPRVTEVTAQIAAINTQIGIEGRHVADALDAEARIETSLLDQLNKTLSDLKDRDASATRNSVQLDALQRNATAAQDLLQNYLTRYGDASARTDPGSQLPDVRVVTFATPATAPASPKTTLILAAVAFVALAGQVGWVLFGELLSGRALVEPGRAPAPMREQRLEDVAPAPEPLVAGADLPMTGRGHVAENRLRRWFNKRAHVEAGTTEAEPVVIAPVMIEPVGPVDAVAPPPDAAAEEPAAPGLTAMPVKPSAEAVACVANPPAFDPDAERRNAHDLVNLSADMILGRARIVVLAALGDVREAGILADRLTEDVLAHGLSVARVDAGGGRVSDAPGLTDLAAGQAGFGDVVQQRRPMLAEIGWGQLPRLQGDLSRPATLVEALAELYESVVIAAGRVGGEGNMRLFAALDARLVLVGLPGSDRIEAARNEALRLGYRSIEIMAVPAWHAEVA